MSDYRPNLSAEQLADYFRQARAEAAGRTMNAWINLKAAQAAERAIEDEETRLMGRRIPPERQFRGDGTASPVAPILDENLGGQKSDVLETTDKKSR
jgi:hypothetical protein